MLTGLDPRCSCSAGSVRYTYLKLLSPYFVKDQQQKKLLSDAIQQPLEFIRNFRRREYYIQGRSLKATYGFGRTQQVCPKPCICDLKFTKYIQILNLEPNYQHLKSLLQNSEPIKFKSWIRFQFGVCYLVCASYVMDEGAQKGGNCGVLTERKASINGRKERLSAFLSFAEKKGKENNAHVKIAICNIITIMSS